MQAVVGARTVDTTASHGLEDAVDYDALCNASMSCQPVCKSRAVRLLIIFG